MEGCGLNTRLNCGEPASPMELAASGLDVRSISTAQAVMRPSYFVTMKTDTNPRRSAIPSVTAARSAPAVEARAGRAGRCGSKGAAGALFGRVH